MSFRTSARQGGRRRSRVQMYRAHIALLAPQPTPDCGFGRSNLETPAPDRWTRPKPGYERKCNRNTVRACLRSNEMRSLARSITTAERNADGVVQRGFAHTTSHFSAALDQHYPQALTFSLYACFRVATMQTLYDLLGALPHDDAQGLRTAFRRAVKGAHPDIRPDDPDAALKFRQIVHASEILGDAEQRAAYDHLLELAQLEQRSASKHATAARIHKLASGVIALAGVSVVTVGGYLLFMHISAASVAPAHDIDVTMRASPEIAAVSPAGLPDPAESASPAKRESTSLPDEAIAPSAAAPQTNAEIIPAADVGPAPDLATSEARSLLARRLIAYRNGELTGSIDDPDRAVQPDPNFVPAYLDRGIIFYRLRKFDRAFADIAGAKRIEKASRSKSTPTTARKPRIHHTAIAAPLTRFARRTAAQARSREAGLASLGGP
jgi:DnaJ domain